MDRDELSAIAHSDNPIAGPLSDDRVDRLVGELDLRPGATVLDLGCGQAEWLLRILERHPQATGEGVDRSAPALARARAAAELRLAPGRLRLHRQDIADFDPDPDGYDLVLCAGSTHLYGGLDGSLAALAGLVRPGGQALVAEGFWRRPPGAALIDLFGDGYRDLAATVDRCEDAGFVPLLAAVSSDDEWDAYEWSWTASLVRHARAHPDDDAADLLDTARTHRAEYLHGYRGVLGYVTLLLLR